MYLWIVVAGGFFSFFSAMGIGANDVANAYATSVGSKALTVRQAVGLATVFEAAGAILMGSHVTKTIRKGIADYECFENDPGALMYGCMWVCFSVGLWLFLASKYEMPVSTTHSCVGGMIGMTVALKGFSCVTWYTPSDTFPYIGGVSGIVLSWLISPVFSALFSSIMFAAIRQFILRKADSFDRTTILFPLIIGGTVTLNAYYIIYKGGKGVGTTDMSLGVATLWSFGAGLLASVAMVPFIPTLKGLVSKKADDDDDIELPKIMGDEDVSDKILTIHDSAEKFDRNTEEYFKYLQVFTAIFDSFSHGANDVANAVGPFIAIYMISQENEVNSESEMPPGTAYWILSMGGIGIGAGLLLYGYNIMRAIGVKMCKITPSRGVSIELASAIVIITGSRLEIPLSTTHCQIGATMGVAALEDPINCSGINWNIVKRSVFGWIATVVVVGVCTGILTAQGAYSPEIGY